MDASSLRKLLDTPEPARLGPEPRAGTRTERELRETVSGAGAGLSREHGQLALALLLLWHDHLAASHVISQGIETSDGSFVHALMHRREPDYGNARYWWRRVGKHPAFAAMGAKAVTRLRANRRNDLADTLAPGGVWDPEAFTEACERVERRAPDDPEVRWLRGLQSIEFEVLLERWLGP